MKIVRLIICVSILVLTGIACRQSSSLLNATESVTEQPDIPIPTQSTAEVEDPSYAGLWISENADQTMTKQVMVISEDNLYWVQTGNWANVKSEVGKEGGVHEEFYVIKSVDTANHSMVVILKWVRTDGRFGGFDMPTKTFLYQVDGDTLRFSFGPEGEVPSEVHSDPYLRQ